MWKGWLAVGGSEVINTARSIGYATTSDCHLSWLRDNDCGGVQDALEDGPYNYSAIANAPWYDSRIPASSRFLGLYGLSMRGISESTREGAITEGITDGGIAGPVRHAGRGVRVRAWMSARGEDALEYGMSWLDAALAPGRCGLHADTCGRSDLTTFVSCPPPRGMVPDFSEWETQAENLATNPSFEATSGTVEVRRNLAANPSAGAATTGWSTNPGSGGAQSAARVTGLLGNGFQVDTGFQVTWTTGTTVPNGGLYATMSQIQGLSAGQTYTFSTQGRSSVGQRLVLSIEWRTAAGASISTTASTPVVVPAGGVIQFSLTGLAPAAATQANATLYAVAGTGAANWPTGATLTATALLVEASPILQPYFDGATQPRLRENLSIHPIASALWNGGYGTGGAGTISTEADARLPGGTARQITWTTAPTSNNGLYIGSADTIPVVAGDTYALSCYVAVTDWADFESYAYIYTPGVTQVLASVTPVGDGLYRVTRVVTVNVGTTVMSPVVTLGGTGLTLPTTTSTFRAGGMLIERSTEVGSYFDGSSTPDPGFGYAWGGTANASASYLYDADLTAAWTGTANNSASVLNGVGLPGFNDVPTQRLPPYVTSNSPLEGSNAARFVLTTGSSIGLPAVKITDPMPAPGVVTTLLVAIRPMTRDTFARPRIKGANSALHNYPVGVWTVERITLPAGVTPDAGGQTGFLLTAGDGHQAGDVIDIDAALVTEGAYTGDYFDGNTGSPNDLIRYEWTGTTDASTSTKEAREAIEREETLPEYLAHIALLRRTLHGVACVSGPLEVESRASADGIHFGRLVEFTLYAGKPWVYADPRPIALLPTDPSVIQDTPFNLAAVPSAEVGFGTWIVGTNFSTNPSVETNTTGWETTSGGGVIPANLAGSRSTTVHAEDGGVASYRVRMTATTTVAVAGQIIGQQDVALPTPVVAGERYSLNMWAFSQVASGTAVLGATQILAIWRNAANTVLRTDTLGTVPAVGGGALSSISVAPPVGATKVLMRAIAALSSWSTGAIVDLYTDALAVTSP